jgi:hypothetical protein
MGKFNNGNGLEREMIVGENLAGPVPVVSVGGIVRLIR